MCAHECVRIGIIRTKIVLRIPHFSMSKPCPGPITVDIHDGEEHPYQNTQDENIDVSSIPSIDRPSEVQDIHPKCKIYQPLSIPVIALLIPSSILGVLARLGLLAMTSYDGESIFPLAYVQALGCLIMGFGLRLKEPIAQL